MEMQTADGLMPAESWTCGRCNKAASPGELRKLSWRNAKPLAILNMEDHDELERFYCSRCARWLNACLGFLVVTGCLGAIILLAFELTETVDWIRRVLE